MKSIILLCFLICSVFFPVTAQNNSGEVTTVVVITSPKLLLEEILKDNSSFYERLTRDFSGSNHNILLTAGVNKVNLLEMLSLNDYNAFFDKAILMLNQASRITNSSVTVDDFYKVIDQFAKTDNMKLIFYGNKENILNTVQKEVSFTKSPQINSTKVPTTINEDYHPGAGTLFLPVLLVLFLIISGFILTNLFRKKQKEKEEESKNHLQQEKESLETMKNSFGAKHVANSSSFTLNTLTVLLLLTPAVFCSTPKNVKVIKDSPTKICVLDISISDLRFLQYKKFIKKRIIEAQVDGDYVITYGDSVRVFDFSKVKAFVNPDSMISYDSNTEIIAAIYKAKELADSLRSAGKNVIVEFYGDFDFDKDQVNQSLLLLKNNLNKNIIATGDTLSKAELFAEGFVNSFPVGYRNIIFVCFVLTSAIFFFLTVFFFIQTNKFKRSLTGIPKNLNIVSETDRITSINLLKPLTRKFKIGPSFDSDLRIKLDHLSGINLEIDKEVNCTFIKDSNGE
ncbi:MAG: hypothetical protein KGZ42_08445 [Melioribacter sp.]|nr:hypothetical protein [Melioribacter sp.]